MKKMFAALVIAALCSPLISFSQTTSKYKCMVQLTNYMGDGAYIVVSLIDSKGAYEKTLYVMGSDKKWYNSLKSWHKFYSKKPSGISAITGASVANGDRAVTVMEIETAKIDKGYKIRFESAVEDKPYYEKDVEMDLTTANLATKTEGKGYIRYVRFGASN